MAGLNSIPIKLKNLANGDVVTEYIPGFAGVIEKVSFVITDKATTADKTAKLNLEIETTNVTGGEITLSSAAGGNALFVRRDCPRRRARHGRAGGA